MDRATAHEKKGFRHNPQHVGWPIDMSIPSFSLKIEIEAVGVKPPSVDGMLLGLPCPYLRHAIGTFNTCSQRSTHRSLTNTGGATTLKVTAFHILLPDLFIQQSSTFHVRAPLGLRLSNSQHKLLEKCDMEHLSPTHGLLASRHLPKSISMPSND
jgi:hypothetical protein